MNWTLAAMKRGATLHLHYQNGRPIWRLSTGPFVTSEAAAIVTASGAVVGVGITLFPIMPARRGGDCVRSPKADEKPKLELSSRSRRKVSLTISIAAQGKRNQGQAQGA